MYFDIGVAILFGLFWTSSYLLLKKKWNLEPEWSCRIVTAIHAISVTSLAGVAWYLGPSPFTDPGGPSTLSQKLTLCVSLGYFFFDMGWCMLYQTEGLTMLLHHICSICAIGRVLFNELSGTEATAGLFCLEITNPFLQARWMLRSAGYKDTLLHTITELIFMVLFIFFRLVWGTYLCYKTVIHPRPHNEAKISAVAFYVLSWVFMLHIARYFLAKYINQRRSQQSAEHTETNNDTASSNTANISGPNTSSNQASRVGDGRKKTS